MRDLIEWTGRGSRRVAAVLIVLAWMGSLSASLHAQQFSHIDQMFFSKGYGGANPLPQVLTVTSTGSDFGFTASAGTSSGGDWLAVSPTGDCCMTPAAVSVIVSASAALAVGSYSGQVMFTGGGTSLIVHVTLVVAPPGGAVFDNTPGQLSFSMKPGGRPPSQVMQIGNGGTGTLNWRLIGSTFNSANFLSVSAQTGTAPTQITLGVLPENLPNGGATEGVYTGQILLLAAGSTVTVPVSVSVGDVVLDQVNPQRLAKGSPGAGSVPFAGTSNLWPANTMNVVCGGFNNNNTGYGGYTTAPDTTNTARFINEANPSYGPVEHYESLYADLGVGQQTLSFYFQANTDQWVFIRSEVDTVVQRVWFNLAGSGAVGNNVPDGWTPQITAVGNGWYRCSVTFSVTRSAIYNGFGLATADQQFSYTATNGNGVYQWGQEWENGTLTDYQANVGPCLSFSKNADANSVAAGSPIGYTIALSNNAPGTVTATAAALNDPLPGGTGINWSISPVYNGPGTCAITGAVGSQTLACSLGDLAAGDLAAVHVTSATSTSGCAAYPNTATMSATNITSKQASATTTVQCPGGALRFVPVTPCRVADTRNATGPFGGPILAAGTPRDFDIPASACGIPTNAAAYSLNLSVVPTGPLGYLTVWPTGQTQPFVATLNSDGRIKGNAAIAPAGVNGAISVFATSATHLIIDINGYYVPAVGVQNLAFYPVTPCRIADTRNAAGPFGGPSLAPAVARDIPVPASPCGIPATAQAYSFNMTVVPPGVLGFLTTWPAGSPQPFVSTLNAPPGIVTANAAIVPAGVNGAISVYATQATDLVIDINGYFAPPGAGSLDFFTVTPCRILDTRLSVGPLGGPIMGAGESRSFPVPSSTCGMPSAAKAYSLNATVVPVTILGYLTLWGDGVKPFVATLNAGDGAITGNAALVPAGASGEVTAFTTQSSHLILDINGYFQ